MINGEVLKLSFYFQTTSDYSVTEAGIEDLLKCSHAYDVNTAVTSMGFEHPRRRNRMGRNLTSLDTSSRPQISGIGPRHLPLAEHIEADTGTSTQNTRKRLVFYIVDTCTGRVFSTPTQRRTTNTVGTDACIRGVRLTLPIFRWICMMWNDNGQMALQQSEREQQLQNFSVLPRLFSFFLHGSPRCSYRYEAVHPSLLQRFKYLFQDWPDASCRWFRHRCALLSAPHCGLF
ncbi:hypothetical protein BXZ70DRAFT_22923 [Cristinia sonorae]|uniref:Uncharacterized protein n=1 Tax=Cristinia sonorae TaxID=1940300 RepID=A0A8K0UZQ5_9AGAR|nr:hypothetical protein BXZ70DRAFT_22923 [Cristinia sonorae]